MKCKKCPYLKQGENLSHVSRLIGYTAKCSLSGILFVIEDMVTTPDWCPLENEKGIGKHSTIISSSF